MPELDERLHGIDRLESPDLWEAARTRAASPRPPAAGPSGGKRILIIAVALVVSAVAIAFVVTAFRSTDLTRPADPARDVVNGDIWVKVGGGDTGTAIWLVPPEGGSSGTLWTDSPNVFAGTTAAPELLGDDYTFSPDGGRVAFSHATAPAPGSGPANQPVELFVMNADGSGLRQLTHDDAYAAFPAWSPDGQTIAYASYRGQGYIPGCVGLSICPSNLYLIDASGGEPSPLVSTTASETSPTWSPDGTRIAFAETNDGQGSIVSAKRDGSGRVELTPGGAVSFPAWSPDGTQISFLRMQEGTNHIWTVTPDDSGHHDIVDTRTDTNFGRAVWSPDGTTIAFARPYAGATAIWTIDRYGDTTPERIAGWPGFDGAPIAWRPVPSGSDTGPVQSESPSGDGSPTASGTPSPEPALFIPPTKTENGTTVVPMVLTDGSRVEIAYPEALGLAELGLAPQTLVHSTQSNGCGWEPLIRLGSMNGVLYQGPEPVNPSLGGGPAMWQGKGSNSPYYLVYEFGEWSVNVPCDRSDFDGLEAWNDGLQGRVTPDGFLVLDTSTPIVREGADPDLSYGPGFIFGGSDGPGFVVLTLGTRCDSGTGLQRDDDSAQWCVAIGDGAVEISVYALNTNPAGRQFIDSVVDGLEVRSIDVSQ